MQQSPQTAQLSKVFKEELDPHHQNFTTKQVFSQYIMKQPQPKLQIYQVQQLFTSLKQPYKMSEDQFITFMIAYRSNMWPLALARFKMAREISVMVDASPSANPTQMKHSHLKLKVNAKKQENNAKKGGINIEIGKNSEQQQKKQYCAGIESIKNIVLGRKISELAFVLKFRVYKEHEKLRSSIESVLEQAKSLAGQMLEQPVIGFINMLQFTVKCHKDYIYIFLEVENAFINDTIRYVHELIQSINPSLSIKLKLSLQSNYLQKFIDNQCELSEKMDDIQIKVQADNDSFTVKKIKEVLSKTATHVDKPSQRLILSFILLLEEVQLDSQFKNTQSLLTEVGIKKNELGFIKDNLSSIKQMNITETLAGFVPSFGELFQLIKENSQSEVSTQDKNQICLNIGQVYLNIQYNISMGGLLAMI